MLEGILEDIEFVSIVKVKLNLGPNTLTSEVAVRIRESMPNVQHVLVGVFSVVIIEAAWIPWGI